MRRHTASLFDDLEPAVLQAAAARAVALHVLPSATAPVSAAAKAFNLQLTRIDKLKQQMQELDALAQAHRQALHEHIAPLEQRQTQSLREMVKFLDQRLAGKGLSALQRKTARQMVCDMARSLAQGGDAEMAAVHDRHSAKDLATLEREQAQALREDMEATLGGGFEGFDEAASAEQVLRAGMERMRQAIEDEQKRRSEAAEKRRAKKKPSAAQALAQAQMDDAQTTLRRLYRQLASALHPDREPDAQARLAKTALMSEANAAYGRKDLVGLMHIQHRAALADPQAAAQMSDEKLAALTLWLKRQVADLERDRAARQAALVGEFGLPWGRGLTRATLLSALVEQKLDMQNALNAMAMDLEQVQQDAGLKRWLREQRDRQAQSFRVDDFSAFGDDFF